MSRQNRFIIYLIFVLCFSIIFSYKNNPQGFISLSPFHQTAQVSSINQSQAQIFIPAKQTKFSNCQIHGSYPDPECTPGAYIATATKDDICAPGYAKSVRNVSESQKKNIYAEYGITHRTTGEYEIDHFISLELGGSNETSNLFPEAAEPRPGFHEKDKVENYLHNQVCSGYITLNEAQREIATDWYAVYQRVQ